MNFRIDFPNGIHHEFDDVKEFKYTLKNVQGCRIVKNPAYKDLKALIDQQLDSQLETLIIVSRLFTYNLQQNFYETFINKKVVDHCVFHTLHYEQ